MITQELEKPLNVGGLESLSTEEILNRLAFYHSQALFGLKTELDELVPDPDNPTPVNGLNELDALAQLMRRGQLREGIATHEQTLIFLEETSSLAQRGFIYRAEIPETIIGLLGENEQQFSGVRAVPPQLYLAEREDFSTSLKERNLPQRVINALLRSNIGTLDDLSGMSDEEILSIRTIGKKSLKQIRAVFPQIRERIPTSDETSHGSF